MVFVYITTNVSVDKMPTDFNLKAAEKFSEISGQPLAHIALIINAGANLSMCGTKEPSVVLVVEALKAFAPEKNGALFREAADFFKETLDIKICRTYSKFVDYDPAFVGVCGMTMEKMYDMMAKDEFGETCVCGEKHG